MVKNLLDGNLESTLYEDQLREMYGIHAYIAFTMDKLVQNIVRQLQHIASEESGNKVKELYEDEKKNNATGGRVANAQHRQIAENMYQKRAETALAEENSFKVMIVSFRLNPVCTNGWILPSQLRVHDRWIIFLFLNQNICYGYLKKEPSQWNGSFEDPKHVLKMMSKQIFTILRWKFLFI